jgi:hypothetical protein
LSLGVLVIAWGAQAQTIVGSQHDLTPTGASQDPTGTTSTDVCVFCHTPHGSDISATVPLWNKTLPGPGGYTRYSVLQTAAFDGLEAPVGSVSIACLSCHDGTQAMDVVLNAPGSGMNTGQIGTMAAMGGTPVPNLSTDLRDDHPISVQYGGGGALNTDPNGLFAGTLGDPDFNPPFKATINGQPMWWVDSPEVAATGTREKTDMLLYTRNDAVGGGGQIEPFVECGSCHDPHNNATKGPGQVGFLRIDQTDSQICTTCHTK